MSEHFFVRVPVTLYDARRQNVITSLQFDIMVLLHRWANWHTGVVRTCSAERLQRAMGDLEKPPSERTIQRHMQGLHEAGWIHSHYRKGSRKPYPVDLNNFMPVADGDAEMALIRPTPIKDWEETTACRVADEGATEDGEGTLRGRGKGGLKETVSETSQETSDETSGIETSGGSVNQPDSQAPSARVGTVTSSPNPLEPTEEAKVVLEGKRILSSSEIATLQCIFANLYDMEANLATLQSIADSHPDFVWVDASMKVFVALLSRKDWKKSITTPSAFAFRWRGDRPTGLWAQALRDMPDNPSTGSVTYNGTRLDDGRVQCQHCEQIFKTQDEWVSHTECIGTKRYLEGEIDMDEPESEPEPETVNTGETVAEVTSRTQAWTIYNGGEILPVIEAYGLRVPGMAWGYRTDEKWIVMKSRDLLEMRLNMNKPKPEFTMEDV
jgi:hypothetical protein